MRGATFVVALCFLMWGAAGAATYQITFTGKKLKPVPGEPPISGVTELVVVLSLPAAPPANQCTATSAALSSFTDGINSLASLESAGWTISSVYLGVCMDSTGKKILSWDGDFILLNGYPSNDYYGYSANWSSSVSQNHLYFPKPYYYSAQIQHIVNGNLAGLSEDWNPSNPGIATLKKLP